MWGRLIPIGEFFNGFCIFTGEWFLACRSFLPAECLIFSIEYVAELKMLRFVYCT